MRRAAPDRGRHRWAKAAWGRSTGSGSPGARVRLHMDAFDPKELLACWCATGSARSARATVYRYLIKEDLAAFDLSALAGARSPASR